MANQTQGFSIEMHGGYDLAGTDKGMIFMAGECSEAMHDKLKTWERVIALCDRIIEDAESQIEAGAMRINARRSLPKGAAEKLWAACAGVPCEQPK